MRKAIYVLDTSVYLHDASAVYQFSRNDIIVPLKVLEEIDKHKKRQDSVGSNARKIIRIFDELRERGNIKSGVRISKGKGVLRTVSVSDTSSLPIDLDPSVPDHMILATALNLAKKEKKKVILVSRDINLRVICDSIGMLSQDYNQNKVVENHTELFTGCREVLVDQQDIDSFYEGGSVILDQDISKKIHPNEFLMLISNSNEKSTALAKIERPEEPVRKIRDFKSEKLWGI